MRQQTAQLPQPSSTSGDQPLMINGCFDWLMLVAFVSWTTPLLQHLLPTMTETLSSSQTRWQQHQRQNQRTRRSSSIMILLLPLAIAAMVTAVTPVSASCDDYCSDISMFSHSNTHAHAGSPPFLSLSPSVPSVTLFVCLFVGNSVNM
jgi:hypothetical protein